MTPALRKLLRRLAVRAAAVAIWLGVHALLARGLAGWDAGLHLLAGGTGALVALAVLSGFFVLHLVTYFALPAIVTVSCVRAVARYRDERRAGEV